MNASGPKDSQSTVVPFPVDEDAIAETLEVPGPSDFKELHGYDIEDDEHGDETE